MKSAVLILSLFLTSNLTSVRTLFFEENSEKVNIELFEKTENVTLQSDPALYAYNGLAIMRKAEYTFNPYTKLSYFKKGKTKVEAAIKTNPKNAELRFIRLSIQDNIPSFLGYSDDISSDKKIVIEALKNKNFSSDLSFTKNVIKFMASSNILSITEEQFLLDLYL